MNDERNGSNEMHYATNIFLLKIFFWERNIPWKLGQYHARWYSSFWCRQILSSHGIHIGYALRFHDYLVTRFWLYKDTLIIFLSVFVSLPTEIATSHVKLKVTCMAIPFQVRIPFLRFGAVVVVLGVSVSPTIGREVCPISPGPGSRLTT